MPEALIARSADARATANESTRDAILSAWTGGAPVAAPAAPATPAPEPETQSAPQPEAEPAPVATIEIPAPVVEPEPEDEDIEPVPLGRRLRTATRIGSWTGAILGLFAFLIATSFWAPSASVTGEGTFNPVLQVDSTEVIVAIALVSIVLGIIVAGLSRAGAGWVDKGMRLADSPTSTAVMGAVLGLVLGLIAATILTGAFGDTPEDLEGLVQLPVLATLSVMIIGGAVLGAVTALVPQLTGVPVAVGGEGNEEVEEVKSRLAGAMGVPAAAALILLLLVIPFAWALIESNELTSGGAAIIAIITAAGILTFASLGGSKPNMKLSFGEVMVAVIGIATVVVVIFLVLAAMSDESGHEDPEPEAAVVQLWS